MKSLEEIGGGEVEEFIGIRGWASSTPGIGGVIKLHVDDFVVDEVLSNGMKSNDFLVPPHIMPGAGTQILCVLEKRNRDTLLCLSGIAAAIGVGPASIGVCGLKDKRAVTTQFVTIPLKFREAAESVRKIILRNARLIPVKRVSRPVFPHMLARNEFKVRIRGVKHSPERAAEMVTETLALLRATGIPNFFGHQRFGVRRPINHVVGRLIVKGRLHDAVKTFVTSHSRLEVLETRLAREKVQTQWSRGGAPDQLPPQLEYERRILASLDRRKEDYLEAVRAFPLRLRKLLVQSYSSYVFNQTLSELLSTGDLLNDPVPGDLVAETDFCGLVKPKFLNVNQYNIQNIRERLVKGRLAVVLPVPGYQVEIPKGPKGELMARILDQEKVSLEDFNTSCLPEAGTRGAYRPVCLSAAAIKMLSTTHDNETCTVALHLEVSRGGYATSVLREFMKSSSALAYDGEPFDRFESILENS
ncbi:MAG: tRNA pseudouridine(13) synthase TruD [Nitrososphaeria archaeon]